MKTSTMALPFRPFHAALLAVFVSVASMAMLRAETPSTKLTPPASTNLGTKSEEIAINTNTVPAAPAPPESIVIKKSGDGDDEDIKELGDHSLNLHIDRGGASPHEGMLTSMSALLIPITAILATFGTPVLIVFFVCYFKHRRRQDNLALAREFLAKGMPIPAELLDPSLNVGTPSLPNSPSRCQSDIRKGFKWAFIGLGITLALFVNSPHSSDWGWGLIPTVIGIGLLISGWVELRQQQRFTRSGNLPPPSNPL